MPKVSVIIPTYNYGQYIARAIDSVLNQTYQDFELIVVDDGSTDNTEEIIRTKQNDKIRYFYQENKGAPSARNKGIEESKGKYTAFLDADDEWFPSKLEKQIEKFQKASARVGLVYSGLIYIWKENEDKAIKIVPTLRGNIFVSFLKVTVLGSPTPLIKKNCFQKAGLFDERLPSCQDWDMWLRISKYYEVDYVPEILAKHYIHKNQITEKFENKIHGREIMIEKYHDYLLKYPLILSRHFSELGKLNCMSGNWKEGFEYFFKAINLDPSQSIKIPFRDGLEIFKVKLKQKLKPLLF